MSNAATTTPAKKSGPRIPGFAQLQRLGKSLMLPIARVEVGQTMITYDVPAVEAAGRNPIIPVVVMDKKADAVSFTDAVIDEHVNALQQLFSVR